MSNDPNGRPPAGWPPPPTVPSGAQIPYGQPQPQAAPPIAAYPPPQYPPPQYPGQAAANPYASNPYAQPQQPIQVVVQNQMQPYGYPQYAAPYAVAPAGLKKETAILLCVLGFFFGVCGLHRFYLRQTALGIVWLLTGGVCAIGQIIDAISLLTMSQMEFDRRYNYPQLPP